MSISGAEAIKRSHVKKLAFERIANGRQLVIGQSYVGAGAWLPTYPILLIRSTCYLNCER